jgi:hypothetical protein
LNIALPPAWELHLAALGMQVMPMLLGMIKSNRVIAAILLEFVKPLWAI